MWYQFNAALRGRAVAVVWSASNLVYNISSKRVDNVFRSGGGCLNLRFRFVVLTYRVMNISIPYKDLSQLPFAQGHKASVRINNAHSFIWMLMDSDEGGRVMPTSYIREWWGVRMLPIIRDLIDAGVVERVPYISSNGRPYYYRTASEFNAGEAMRYRLTSSYSELPETYLTACPAIEKRVSEVRIIDEVRTLAAGEPFKAMRDDLRAMIMDVDAARAYVSGLGRGRASLHRSYIISEWEHHAQGGQVLFNLNDNCGRLFTTLTKTPKDLRPFLGVPGLDLVSLDICNSQPFLLAALSGCDRVLNLAASGLFYDHFAGLLGVGRDEVKSAFFALFYSHPNWMPAGGWYVNKHVSASMQCKNELDALFLASYPEFREWSIIQRVKNGYKFLALEMQRKEAAYIFEAVKRYKAACGGFVATIHDAVVIDRGGAGLMGGVCEALAVEMFGKAPRLKIEQKFKDAT